MSLTPEAREVVTDVCQECGWCWGRHRPPIAIPRPVEACPKWKNAQTGGTQ